MNGHLLNYASANLLIISVLTALLCNGLQIATEKDMILHFIKVWLDKVFINRKLGPSYGHPNGVVYVSNWYYPILHCIKCMPSVYGTGLCLLMLPITPTLLWQIPLVVLCAVCFSTIINQQYA